MKDLHNHILFGIDDGCESLEESIRIIKMAERAGYTDLILTPHYRASQDYTCGNKKKKQIFDYIQGEVEKRKIPVHLYLGNEVTLDEDFFYYLKSNRIMPLNGSRYILLELPFLDRYSDLDDTFDELLERGFIPIIAHPERYDGYHDFDEIASWIKKGVLLQGNIGSLYGKYGSKAKEKLEELLKRHMIHFISSDIHHDSQTSLSRIKKVILKLEELTGSKEMAMDLVDKNIDKVIRDLPIEPYNIRVKKSKLKIFRSLSK